MSESFDQLPNLHSGGVKNIPLKKQRNYGDIDIFNASTADYIATTILMLVGGILYISVTYSTIFAPVREWFAKWKTQLLVNTFMKDSETIHLTYNETEPSFLQKTLQTVLSIDGTPSEDILSTDA